MSSQKPGSCFCRNLVHVSTETWFRFPQKPGSCFEKVVGVAPLCFCFWRVIFFIRFAEQFSMNCTWFCLGQFPKNRRGKYFSAVFAFSCVHFWCVFSAGGATDNGFRKSQNFAHTHAPKARLRRRRKRLAPTTRTAGQKRLEKRLRFEFAVFGFPGGRGDQDSLPPGVKSVALGGRWRWLFFNRKENGRVSCFSAAIIFRFLP